jgi:hypothetical protein
MPASRKTKISDFPKIQKELKMLDGSSVEVGVFKGEHAWLAGIHEYGCSIEVTPKMRAWLHYQGVHLKKDTTHIIIPERSFLRAGFDENEAEVSKRAVDLLADVACGRMTARGCQQAVGIHLSSKIKDYAVDLGSPPNSGFTTGRKGSSNPLVDTGDMIGGIGWRVGK